MYKKKKLSKKKRVIFGVFETLEVGASMLPENVVNQPTLHRLRWSRGSVLAFVTQVHGFKPGFSMAKNSSARLPSEGK
jgi:hypothetical protein